MTKLWMRAHYSLHRQKCSIKIMQAGDKVRLLQIGILCGLASALVVGLWAFANERPLWWAIPPSVASGLFGAWAGLTFFGIAHIERLAAHRVHGGRHHYFERQEVRVVFDQADDVWLCLDDMRKCVGGDATAIRHYAAHEAATFEGRGRRVYLSVAGARRYLRLARHPDLPKFIAWFETDLLAPIERRRERGLPLYGSGEGRI